MKTLILLLIPIFIQCQEFLTTITAVNSENQIDSIQIGYDANATGGLDLNFGEQDIQNLPFSGKLDIRTGELHYGKVNCFENISTDDSELLTFMSKSNIVLNECPTISGEQITTIFINNKYLPLTLYWDKNVFNEFCTHGTFITDWQPQFWFDVTNCGNEYPGVYKLAEQDSLNLNSQTDTYLVHGDDTLSIFYIGIGPLSILSNEEIIQNKSIVIYPNPTTGIINIKSNLGYEINSKIYSLSGRLEISSNGNPQIDLQNLKEGVYLLELHRNNKIIDIVKIIKYGH